MGQIFKGIKGDSGSAPTTIKTINKNANRNGSAMNSSLRDYAGSPRPATARKDVVGYARGVSMTGDGSATAAAKRQSGPARSEPPMGNAPSYNPVSMKDPVYNGPNQTTAPAKLAADAHGNKSMKGKY